MKAISTRAHGIIDLAYSAAFLAAPVLMKTAIDGRKLRRIRSEQIVLPAIGATILAEGLMTKHELGAIKALPMPAHLALDLGLSAFIAASPWLFNMDKVMRIPMIAAGVAGAALAVLTEKESKGGGADDLQYESEI
jgi:hypothetical protein